MTTRAVQHPTSFAIRRDTISRLLTVFVASVWLVHGLYNKLLGGSPRHLAIVQSIPGFAGDVGRVVLMWIGIAEVVLAIWIISGRRARLAAIVQTVALLAMNVLELSFARQHLLSPMALLPVSVAFLALAWISSQLNDDPRRDRVGLFMLRRHPFPVVAHFRDCVVLTYALPPEVLLPLLPPGLELETSNGFGYVAVALVETERLRPAGLPRALGRDFFLAGYRVFMTFRRPDGRTLRGLRIVRSDADRGLMVAGGNLLTHYNYHRCTASFTRRGERLDFNVTTPDRAGNLDAAIDLSRHELPIDSPFTSERDARRFAGPLPHTFDFEPETHSIVAIRAARARWSPRLVTADVRRIAFFDQPCFRGCTPVLAAAFHVADVDYRWERGVRYALPTSEGESR